MALLGARPSQAAERHFDSTLWNINGNYVFLIYALPDRIARDVVEPNAPTPNTQTVGDYILAHISASRGGIPCSAMDQGLGIGRIDPLAFTPGLLRYEVIFRCKTSTGPLTLSNTAFMDRVPDHVDFARVRVGKGGSVQSLFSARQPRLDVPVEAEDFRSASPLRYVMPGLKHALGSAVIIIMALSLLLVAGSLRRCWWALAGLVAGYSASFLLAVFGLTSLRGLPEDMVFGLLITVATAGAIALKFAGAPRWMGVAATILLLLALPASFRYGAAPVLSTLGVVLATGSLFFLPTNGARRTGLLLAASFIFALLDGSALASDLTRLTLPEAALAPILSGFGTGALIGETIPLLAATAILLPYRRYWPNLRLQLPGQIISAAFLACGIYWFVSGPYG
jgi:hypothetical protein